MIPLIFVKTSAYLAKAEIFFKAEVNKPATRIIIPCPRENKNSIKAE